MTGAENPREVVLSDRIQRLLCSQGIDRFIDRYKLDGEPLSTRHSVGMLATTAVGSPGGGDAGSRRPLLTRCGMRRLRPATSGKQRYYVGMVYLMSMLHCSGNFRIIE